MTLLAVKHKYSCNWCIALKSFGQPKQIALGHAHLDCFISRSRGQHVAVFSEFHDSPKITRLDHAP